LALEVVESVGRAELCPDRLPDGLLGAGAGEGRLQRLQRLLGLEGRSGGLRDEG